MTINTLWVQHLPEEKREEFKQTITSQSSNIALKRLKEIVVTKRQIAESSERSPLIYEKENWAHLQAHNNGVRQMLKMMEDLLAFVEL